MADENTQGTTTTETTKTGTPTGTSDWTAPFDDDLKGYIGNKGFKDPAALATAYRNLEKLRGVPEERLLKLPESFYEGEAGSEKLTADGRAIYERLGAPKEKAQYELDKFLPKENADKELFDTMTDLFFDAGIPKSQAERIVKGFNSFQENRLNKLKSEAELSAKNADEALRKEWGSAYDQNVQLAKEAAIKLGHTEDQVRALSAVHGHQKTMNFYKKLGEAVGESKYIDGNPAPRTLEPANAKSKIKDLMKDKSFTERFFSGDVEAKAQLDRLHRQAYPGEVHLN